MAWHARLPSSKTEQWAICPGSQAYGEAQEDASPSTIYGMEGTCAHALVERCLGEESDPLDYLGRLIEIINPDTEDEGISILRKGAKLPKGAGRIVFEVDLDMAEAVKHMTDYVYRRVEELGISMKQVQLESRVTPLPHRNDTGGTCDVIIDAWPILLEVVDYKHGAGVFVPIDKNSQLRSYSLGVVQDLGPAADDYEFVKYTICQPRHKDAPFDGIMSEEISVSDLKAWGDWLSVRADKVDEARKLVANGANLADLFEAGYVDMGEKGKHCRFCDLAKDCPAAHIKAEQMAMVDFDDIPDDRIEVPVASDELARILSWIPALDNFLKQCAAEGERILMAGGEVPGYKLVKGRSSGRDWVRVVYEDDNEELDSFELTDDDLADILVSYYGIPEEEVFDPPKPPTIRSGPKVEKTIPAAERRILNADLLIKREGKPTIAPEEDSRPAIEPEAVSDFDDVED